MADASCLRAVHQQMRRLERRYPAGCRPDEVDARSWALHVPALACPDRLGRALKKARQTELVLHLQFPSDFPFAPPFVRVVQPLFEMMTGHVTAGGAICTEVLTMSDSEHGWRPTVQLDLLVESILVMMGEGGASIVAGKSAYREQDAREGYRRVAARYGWKTV